MLDFVRGEDVNPVPVRGYRSSPNCALPNSPRSRTVSNKPACYRGLRRRLMAASFRGALDQGPAIDCGFALRQERQNRPRASWDERSTTSVSLQGAIGHSQGEIAGALPAVTVRTFVDVNLAAEDGVLLSLSLNPESVKGLCKKMRGGGYGLCGL